MTTLAPALTLDHQTDRLVALGYPALAGLDEDGFREVVVLRGRGSVAGGPLGRDGSVRPADSVQLLRARAAPGPAGSIATTPRVTSRPTSRCRSSTSRRCPAYLLLDVDRGEEFCGVRPEDALPVIRSRGRTPLTIDEGIAVVTQVPRLLEKNKCFMLSGSRRHDRRVPALWISERAPKLGWCWDGNPHTWLGVASASGRAPSAEVG